MSLKSGVEYPLLSSPVMTLGCNPKIATSVAPGQSQGAGKGLTGFSSRVSPVGPADDSPALIVSFLLPAGTTSGG